MTGTGPNPPTQRPTIAGLVGCVAAIALCWHAGVAQARVTGAEDAQIVKWLSELKPLPKTHYSWPLKIHSLSDDLLYQYARLTHAISLSGEGYEARGHDLTSQAVHRAARACKRVNVNKPNIRCSIAVTYSVWHRRFGKGLPPTNVGPTHADELAVLAKKLSRIRDDLRAAGKGSQNPVVVSAVLFDSERFVVTKNNNEWNDAIDNKHNTAYDVARDVFPKVRIEWYSRGSISPASSANGWRQGPNLTLREKGGSFSCSLYRVPEIGVTREIFRRTVENARRHGVLEVTPWIALASGYRRRVDQFHAWSFNWNYDLVYSWQLGLEVNRNWYGRKEQHERYAPWNAAKIAVFYPEPFSRVPHWAVHFIAYVRGANGVKEISDLPLK